MTCPLLRCLRSVTVYLMLKSTQQRCVLDISCSHPGDLERKKTNRKEIFEPKRGATPCCSLCLCFSALQFPARQTCCSLTGSAKADVYCQNSSRATCFVSSLSSGVLSILCKSSNQHAQILFNFTASRGALISSRYLGCILLLF